jgi:hypothetical protein
MTIGDAIEALQRARAELGDRAGDALVLLFDGEPASSVVVEGRNVVVYGSTDFEDAGGEERYRAGHRTRAGLAVAPRRA